MLPWGVAMVLLALALAVLAWRRSVRVLGEPVQNAERHARAVAAALAADTPAPAPPELHGAEEFAELGAALAEAHAAAIVRDRRLRALAEAGALVLWRADAAGGWTEAAGWAGLTGQTAPAFRGDGWLEMLHRDDRAPTLAEWGRSLVARSLIGVEFRLRMADETAGWRWVRATGVPITSEDGQILEWVGAIHDVAEARGAGQAHRFNEAQVRQTVAELRAVYDTVPVGLALVDPDLRFVNVNARFAAISGLPTEAHIGRAPHEVMPDGLSGPLQDAQRRVFETGRPMLDVACSGPAPGAVQHLRHWLASCHPVKDAEGNVTGVSAVLQDVTERVRAERSRELLVTELNHRVKNTLSTVQAIAAQSLRGTAGAAGVGREFVGRLQALMRSHDLLSDQGWQPVDLARVVRAGLMPWIEAGRPIRIGGSGRIQATPSQTQALVLALGELAGNATRHGALSRPGGEVEVAWSLAEDGIATLDWRESGGPPVTPPPADRRGFGIRLLERGLVHDLGPGADVRLRFPEDGVEASVRFRAGQPSLVAEEAA
jgi:PAS domain S-box-containing protein